MSSETSAGGVIPADTDRATTTVHLMRHGEVHNPEGILYGRRDGYHLTALGERMAQRVASALAGRDITAIWSSPLERAQQTAAPLASMLDLEVRCEERIWESTNVFEGEHFGAGLSALRRPRTWKHLWNPWRPSWGEPYREIAARMRAAVDDARAAAEGHEAVLVSHQLPIWITRLSAEGRSYLHDPRQRQCTLTSLTSLRFTGDRLTQIAYSEPAADLIPVRDRGATFSAGGGEPGSAGPSPTGTRKRS